MQLGAQLCVGQVIVTLFVVVKKLSFRLSCLASIFYVAAELLVAQDQHVVSCCPRFLLIWTRDNPMLSSCAGQSLDPRLLLW